MFALTVGDHVRLNSEQAAQNYTVHARAAERLARSAFFLRMTVLTLLAVAAASTTISSMLPERSAHITAAATSLVALVGFAAYLAIGLEGRVMAHRTIAHRLWLLCERHPALLGEMTDGLLDRAAIIQRRDDLIQHAHAVYEHNFAADQNGHESTRTRRLDPQTATSTAG